MTFRLFVTVYASCTNLANFGPVTPEITRVEIATFGMIRQDLTYPVKYLRRYSIDLHPIFRVGRHISGDYGIIKLKFFL